MNFFIFLIIICTAAILYFLYKNYRVSERKILIQSQDFDENINLAQEETRHQEALTASYKTKAARYNSLEDILNKLNTTLSLAGVSKYLVEEVFKLVAQSDGNVILYLLNKSKQKLEILRSYRQTSNLIIKAKEGDIFDYWVLKQLKPLLVEDTKTDFRFDLESMDDQPARKIKSLIITPLVSRDNLIGVLRIDRDSRVAFTIEDLRLLSTISDIAAVAIENSLLYQRTEELAIVDSLTRVYQRSYFLERLNQELPRIQGESKMLALIMIDIDYFKNYNDEFGHIAGDMVLRRVASILKTLFSSEKSLCCRFGGEEFLLYVGDSTKEKINLAVEDLRKRVEQEKIVFRRQNTAVTISIGVVYFPDEAATTEDLVKLADSRMYNAKSQGRNQICFS